MEASRKDATILDKDSIEKADVVLVDVPCSGLGVIGKKTDIKYRTDPDKIRELVVLQRQILHNAAAYVKPGGTLIYSTCTITREENQENVQWFVENYPYELEKMCIRDRHSTPQGHLELTSQKQEPVLAFAHALERAKIPMIVRHVAVPGVTDGKEHLERLGELLAPFRNLKGLEVLPYHTMGLKKYEALGIPYPLKGVEPMDKAQALTCRNTIVKKIQEIRAK